MQVCFIGYKYFFKSFFQHKLYGEEKTYQLITIKKHYK
jgi:hypothetical protein